MGNICIGCGNSFKEKEKSTKKKDFILSQKDIAQLRRKDTSAWRMGFQTKK